MSSHYKTYFSEIISISFLITDNNISVLIRYDTTVTVDKCILYFKFKEQGTIEQPTHCIYFKFYEYPQMQVLVK